MTDAQPNMISPTDFIKSIEKIVADSGTDYIDAVMDYCTKHGIEVETAADIIKSNSSIKMKVRIDAEKMNVVEKTTRLPL